MSELNDFLSLIAEAKKQNPVSSVKVNTKADLGGLFAQLAEAKQKDPVAQKAKQIEKQVSENVKSDLASLFSQLSSIQQRVEMLPEETEGKEEAQQIIAEVMLEPVKEEPTIDMDVVGKYLTDKSFQQPNPDPPSKDIDDIRLKIKFLEQWLGKISAHGPGSGEVNLRYLDDVARETISDGRWLKYDGSRKKFVFDEINPYEVVYNTTEVTTSTYTVEDNDYYIGVNYAGPVTITLPSTANSGRVLVIKDEDGDAETNPITVQGTVDNDAGGFIIQINNGAIQLIYRNGWRII